MKLFGAAIGAALLVACIDQSASAATGNVLFNGTITATLPQRQDEVHASDGTTCRSAVSGSGAYLDVGVIRGNSNCQSNSDVATYGRVVTRLDGSRSASIAAASTNSRSSDCNWS
jgi:hypothetical protein